MKELISPIISNMSDVGKAQSKFLETLFPAILATRGHVTFRNLSRYSDLHEKTYNRQFAKAFDFVSFNRALIDDVLGTSNERILAFDASFIKKSGKFTFGRGFSLTGRLKVKDVANGLSAIGVAAGLALAAAAGQGGENHHK